jgi:very-short-patch-repair endonuclease
MYGSRDAFLLSQGFRVLRFDNYDVIFSGEAVHLEIEAALKKYILPEPPA